MIKKSFRLMLLVAFALSSVMFVACNKYDDDIDGLQSQIDQLNATVQNLQTAISNGAVITNVAETSEGIKVTLSNNQSYVIKNGTNGKDGANGTNGVDGKNGSVITIGENGNWFIDGVDTNMPAQGAKGDKGDKGDTGAQGPAGTNGTNGTDGKDGKDADQVYYYPCTDKESANYGKWIKVTNDAEEATTETWLHEGVLTAVYDSENGVLVVVGVEGATNGRVEIATGAHLASLAFVPNTYGTGIYDCGKLGMPSALAYTIEKYYSSKWNFVANNDLGLVYRVNPTNAMLKDVEFSFVDRVVKTKVEGDNSTLLTFNGYEVVDGGIKVDADLALAYNKMQHTHKDYPTDSKHNIFALKATLADGGEVVSDYAELYHQKLRNFAIVGMQGKGTRLYNHICLPNSVLSNGEITDVAMDALVNAEICASFAYTETLDLDNIVDLLAHDGYDVNNNLINIDLVKNLGFDVEIKFSMVEEFCVVDATEQDYFVNLDEENVLSVVKGASAIGRTPAFLVRAYVNDVELANALIKVKILAESAKEAISIFVDGGVIEYSDIVKDGTTNSRGNDISTKVVLPWEKVNDEIYDVLNLSAKQFATIYADAAGTSPYMIHRHALKNAAPADAQDMVVYGSRGYKSSSVNYWKSNGGYNGIKQSVATGAVTNRGVIAHMNGIAGATTSSDAAYIAFDPEYIYQYAQKDTVSVIYRSADNRAYGDVTINFVYEIQHTKSMPAVNPDYHVGTMDVFFHNGSSSSPKYNDAKTINIVKTSGKFNGTTWDLESGIAEMFENYLVKTVSGVTSLALPGNHESVKFDLVGIVDQYDYNGYTDNSTTSDDYKFVENAVIGVSGYNPVLAANYITLRNTSSAISTPSALYNAEIASASELAAYETNGRIAVIKVTLAMANGSTCVDYFGVRFESPIKVSMNQITIQSDPYIAVAESATKSLVIVTNTNSPKVLWENGDLTEYAKRMGLTANIFGIEFKDPSVDASFGTDNPLTLETINALGTVVNPLLGYEKDEDGNDIITSPIYKFNVGEKVYQWDNKNNELVQDKTAKSNVTVTLTGVAVSKAKGDITIKK